MGVVPAGKIGNCNCGMFQSYAATVPSATAISGQFNFHADRRITGDEIRSSEGDGGQGPNRVRVTPALAGSGGGGLCLRGGAWRSSGGGEGGAGGGTPPGGGAAG